MHKIITLVFFLISFAAISQTTNRFNILTSNEVYNLIQVTPTTVLNTNDSIKLDALPESKPIILRTPPCGVDPWFAALPVGQKSSETNMTRQIDHLYTNNLTAFGWKYIQLADGWQGTRSNGVMLPNPTYISNITNLCAYANARGIGVIVYTEPRQATSNGGANAGSLGYEEQDVAAYIAWGAKGVRLDMPNMNWTTKIYWMRKYRSLIDKYTTPSNPVLLYSSGWQEFFLYNTNAVPIAQAASVADVLDITLDNGMMGPTVYTDYLARWRRQLDGHYLVRNGMYLVPQGTGNPVNNTYKSFYGLYALIGSGSFLASVPAENSTYIDFLKNPAIYSLRNDPSTIIKTVSSNANSQVVARYLSNGDIGLALVNNITNSATTVTVNFTDIGLSDSSIVSIEDVSNNTTLSNATGTLSYVVPANEVITLKLTKSISSSFEPTFLNKAIRSTNSVYGSSIHMGNSGLTDYSSIGFVYRPGKFPTTVPWEVSAIYGNTNRTVLNVPNIDPTKADIGFRFYGTNYAGAARMNGVWVFGNMFVDPTVTASFTNTVIAQGRLIVSNGITAGGLTLPTNSTAPSDLVNIKAWINVTNSTGGVFKMPLYQ